MAQGHFVSMNNNFNPGQWGQYYCDANFANGVWYDMLIYVNCKVISDLFSVILKHTGVLNMQYGKEINT